MIAMFFLQILFQNFFDKLICSGLYFHGFFSCNRPVVVKTCRCLEYSKGMTREIRERALSI